MDAPVGIRGDLVLTFTDSSDGSVREITARNKVVTNGLGWIMGRCTGGNPATLSTIGIGSNNKTVADSDGWLQAQLAAQPLTWAYENATIVMTATFGEGLGTGTIQELGIFLSNGSLFARTVVTAQTKSATTTLQVKWVISFQAV